MAIGQRNPEFDRGGLGYLPKAQVSKSSTERCEPPAMCTHVDIDNARR
jgi:hypothetical protein